MEMEEMDLLELWRILVKRRWWITAIVVITIAAAGLASGFMEPVYEASTTVMVRGQGGGGLTLQELNPLAGFGGGSSAGLDTYVEILQSRAILEQVIESLGLENSVGNFRDSLTIQPISNTELLRISVESSDNEQAMATANVLVDTFLEWNRAANQEELRGTGQFLEGQLEVVSANLARAEERLQNYRETERVLAPTDEIRALLERMVEIEGQLATSQVTIPELDHRLQLIQQELEQQDQTYIASTTIQDNPFMRDFRTRLSETEVKLAGARERYTEQHPEVLALRAEIEEVKRKLAGEVERVIATETESISPIHQHLYQQLITLQVDRMAYESRNEALTAVRDALEKEFQLLPSKELELTRLLRDAKVQEEVYIMLVKRYEENRINEAMQTADAQVVDRAIIPDNPVRPRVRLNIAIAGVLGLFIGTGISFLSEYTDTTIKNKQQVEKLLGVPVVGEIPRFEKKRTKKRRFGRSARM